MEWAAGDSLDDMLAAGPLDAARGARIIAEAAEAIVGRARRRPRPPVPDPGLAALDAGRRREDHRPRHRRGAVRRHRGRPGAGRHPPAGHAALRGADRALAGPGLARAAAGAARGRASLQPPAGPGGRARRAGRDHQRGHAAAGPGRRLPADHAGAAGDRPAGGHPAGADPATARSRRGRGAAPTGPAAARAGDRVLGSRRAGARVLVTADGRRLAAGTRESPPRRRGAGPAPRRRTSGVRVGVIVVLVVGRGGRARAGRPFTRCAAASLPVRLGNAPATVHADQHGRGHAHAGQRARRSRTTPTGRTWRSTTTRRPTGRRTGISRQPGVRRPAAGVRADPRHGPLGQAELGDGHVRVDPRGRRPDQDRQSGNAGPPQNDRARRRPSPTA